MSFLSEQKNEITEQIPKSACCRRAMLNGIIFSKARILGGETCISLENQRIAEFAATLVKEFFGKDSSISISEKGGRCRQVVFHSPACEKYIIALSSENPVYFAERCANCRQSFLRGVFLACGRMTDPEKQYRLEFAPIARHKILLEYLNDMGISFSITVRRGELIIYTGNSSQAEDFFAAIGMNSTAFLLMNAKIKSEFKNTANRIRNCETNNILKTVSAAARWIDAIEALDRANLLSTLPEELEQTARLRIQFKDYSLARLAAEFTPPISKPGLSHRLNKIVELSENLLGNKDKT